MMSRLLLFLCSLGSAFATDFSPRFDAIRARATPAQLYAFLYALPKGSDLHNHSGGSERPEWLLAACTDPARNGGDTFYTRIRFASATDAIASTARYRTIRRYTYEQVAPAVRAEYVALADLTPAERSAWCSSLRLDEPGEGRAEFFSTIWPRRGQLGENLAVTTEMLVENLKAYGAEHLVYLETQFNAQGFSDNAGHPIAPAAAADYVRRRLAQPDVLATGMTVRFQGIVLRFAPNAEARLQENYAFAAANRDLWVGLNMAGIEENGFGYPARFLTTYRKLRSRFPTLPLSIHAGEMDGPDNHIRDTLLLGASRIGHGVNLIKDPATLLLLQQSRRTLVEINLISNRLLEYTPDLTQHPFPEYLRTGVPVCLNTDDRGMWDSNMTDEYYTAVTTYNLSWSELVDLGRASLEHAFVQSEVKAKLLRDYHARVLEFETRFSSGDVESALGQLIATKPVTYGYAQRTWGLSFAP